MFDDISTGTSALTDDVPLAPEQAFGVMTNDTQVQTIREMAEANNHLAYLAPASLLALAETGAGIFGLDDDLLESISRAGGEDLVNYRKANPLKTSFIGEGAGMFIPGLAAVKLFRHGRFLLSANKPFNMSKQMARALSPTQHQAMTRKLSYMDRVIARTPIPEARLLTGRETLRNATILQGTLNAMAEGAAFEAGVAATMHSSEFLYPSDFTLTGHLAWASLGVILPGSVENLFLRRNIKVNQQEAVGLYKSQAYNPEGRPNVTAVAGQRDIAITVNALMKNDLDAHIQGIAENTTLGMTRATEGEIITKTQQSVKNLQNGLDAIVEKQISTMIKEGVVYQNGEKELAKLLVKSDFLARHRGTLTAQLKEDPTFLLGTSAISSDTNIVDVLGRIDKRISSYSDDISNFEDTLKSLKAKADEGDIFDNAMKQEIAEMESQLTLFKQNRTSLSEMQVHIVEPTGEMSLGTQRLQRAYDTASALQFRRTGVTSKNPEGFLTGSYTDEFGDPQSISIDDAGRIFGEKGGAKKNVTTVLTAQERIEAREANDLLTKDMAEHWHTTKGRRGVELMESLPPEIRQAVDKWRGSSNSGDLRKWQKEGAPEFDILYEAGAPIRARLRELTQATESDTVRLYRGESPQEHANILAGNSNSINDLVSMSSNLQFVEHSFAGAGALIKREVPIDDIVMVIGGAGDEWEFLVRGNTKRILEDSVSQQTLFNLPHLKRSAMFSVMQKFVDDAEHLIERRAKANQKHLTIPDGQHWARMQLVKAARERLGARADALFKLPERLQDPQMLDFEILASKFADWAQLRAKYISDIENGTSKWNFGPSMQKIKISDIDYMVDLGHVGLPGAPTRNITDVFDALVAQGTATKKQFYDILQNYEGLKAFIKRSIGEEMPAAEREAFSQLIDEAELMTHGNAMNIPRVDKTGEMFQPVTLLKRPWKETNDLNAAMVEQAGHNQSHRFAQFMAYAPKILPDGSTDILADGAFVGAIAEKLLKQQGDEVIAGPLWLQANNIDTLVPTEAILHGVIGQKAHQAKGIPALEAAISVTDLTDTFGHKLWAELLSKQVGFFTGAQRSPLGVLNHINSPAQKASKVQFDMYTNARRYGWKLSDTPVKLDDGMWAFPLSKTKADTKHNLNIYNRLLGRRVSKLPDYMPSTLSPDANAIVKLDDAALETAQTVAHLGKVAWSNGNALRQLVGKGARSFTNWWIAPKNFTPSEFNNVQFIKIHGYEGLRPVRSATRGALNDLTEKTIQNLIDNDPKLHRNNIEILTPESMSRRQFNDVHDELFMQIVDYGDPLRATGPSKGRSGLPTLEVGDSVEEMLERISTQMTSITRRTRAALFEGSVTHARMRNHALKDMAPNSEQRNIYGEWLRTIMGDQDLLPDSSLGKLYGGVETLYDRAWNGLWDHLRNHVTGTDNWWKATSEAQNKKVMAELEEKLGSDMPFKNGADFAARTFEIHPPIRMRKHMAALSNMTSLLTLRLFEVGHAILNFTGMMATAPAHLASLNKRAAETHEQWSRRIGLIGSTLGENQIPILHPVKLNMQTAHFWHSAEGKEALFNAEKLGLLDQQVAEIVKTLIEPFENITRRRIRQATDFLSQLSDKSEKLTRTMGHIQGYYLASKHLGIVDEIARQTWAHKYVNELIGNYHPANKPTMFQGAVGMPLGLFQTYMFNYYHRIYNYIENKQARAMTVQAALQTGIFGLESVPGYDVYSEFFASNYDKSRNPTDGIREALGGDAADYLLYGSLSTLPKMLGADDGLALFTRGDANVQRLPTLLTIGEAPGFNMLGDVVQMLGGMLDQFQTGGSFSPEQMVEIAARHFTNRPIRGALEVFQGYRTDQAGRIVEEDTRRGMSLAARAMGLRTTSEEEKTAANYRIRANHMSQRAIRERLRNSIRPKIRNNSLTEDDMMDMFAHYIKTGGKVDNLNGFVKEMYLSSMMENTDREMLKALGSGKMADIIRLMGVYD